MARKKIFVLPAPHPAAGTLDEAAFKGKAHKLTWLNVNAKKTPAELDEEFQEYIQDRRIQYVIVHNTFDQLLELHAFDNNVHMYFRNFCNDCWDGCGETIKIDENGREA